MRGCAQPAVETCVKYAGRAHTALPDNSERLEHVSIASSARETGPQRLHEDPSKRMPGHAQHADTHWKTSHRGARRPNQANRQKANPSLRRASAPKAKRQKAPPLWSELIMCNLSDGWAKRQIQAKRQKATPSLSRASAPRAKRPKAPPL
jgi:hypothetical protein